jgi:hypothetical protein
MAAPSRYYAKVPSELNVSTSYIPAPMESPLRSIELGREDAKVQYPDDERIQKFRRSDTVSLPQKLHDWLSMN